MSKLATEIAASCEKAWVELKRCDADTDKIYVESLEERCRMGWLFLGKCRSDRSTDTVETVEDLVWAKVAAEEGMQIQQGDLDVKAFHATVHQALLQKVLKTMPLLPIEDADKLECMSSLMFRVSGMLVCKGEADVNTQLHEFDQSKVLAGQLRDSIRQACRDLGRQIARRESEAKLMAEKAKKTQETEAKRKAKSELAMQVKTKIEPGNRLYQLDFSGFEMTSFENDGAFMSGIESESSDYSKPFVVKCSGFIQDACIANDEDQLCQSLKKFAIQFPSSTAAKKDHRCSAPMSDTHGLESAKAMLAKFIPHGTMQLCGADCSAARALETTWMYGLTQDFSKVLPEPIHLGSIRCQVVGSCIVIAACVEEVAAYVAKKLNCHKQDVAYSAIVGWLEALDQMSLKEASIQGLDIKHAVIEPKSVLHMPAGYVTAVKVANSGNVIGVRSSYIVPDLVTTTRLTAVRNCYSKQSAATGAGNSSNVDVQNLDFVLTSVTDFNRVSGATAKA